MLKLCCEAWSPCPKFVRVSQGVMRMWCVHHTYRDCASPLIVNERVLGNIHCVTCPWVHEGGYLPIPKWLKAFTDKGYRGNVLLISRFFITENYARNSSSFRDLSRERKVLSFSTGRDGGIRPGLLPKIREKLPFLTSPRPVAVCSSVRGALLGLTLGFVHPSVTLAAKTVLDNSEVGLLWLPLSRIIPCASKVEIMSTEEVIIYNDGITGSHFAVGGIDRIITPLSHLSSLTCLSCQLLPYMFEEL